MNSPPSPVDIKQQLERLRNSETFAGSERLTAFLTYLVEETLAGRGDGLRDVVHITIPTGSYGPQFFSGNSGSHDAVRGDHAQTFKTGAGATGALIPFRALALDPPSISLPTG